ncbi:hypothetical protein DI110_03550 [Legionella pneumophila]|nr:hypothetical protein DI110_03550 [Legionella pneumophila]
MTNIFIFIIKSGISRWDSIMSGDSILDNINFLLSLMAFHIQNNGYLLKDELKKIELKIVLGNT